MQGEKLLGHAQRLDAALGREFLQLHAGCVQQLVGQATGELGEDVLGTASIGQQALGLAQLVVADPFGMLPIGLEHIDCGQFTQALHEIVGAGRNQFLGSLGGSLTTLEILCDHFVQVVDGIQIHVIQLADLGLDVPRHGDIDHEHRLVLAPFKRLFDRALAEDRQLTGSGTDDDVAVMQFARDIGQQDRVRAQLSCQRAGTLEGPIGNDDLFHALLMQVTRHERDRLTGSDQQGLAALQVAEDLTGQADGGKCDGNRVLADGGIRPHRLGRAEGRLEQPAKQRADASGLPRHRVRRFHLAENLRLTQHQRVEARGDTHHVAYGLIVDMHISARLEFLEA